MNCYITIICILYVFPKWCYVEGDRFIHVNLGGETLLPLSQPVRAWFSVRLATNLGWSARFEGITGVPLGVWLECMFFWEEDRWEIVAVRRFAERPSCPCSCPSVLFVLVPWDYLRGPPSSPWPGGWFFRIPWVCISKCLLQMYFVSEPFVSSSILSSYAYRVFCWAWITEACELHCFLSHVIYSCLHCNSLKWANLKLYILR